MPGWGVPMKHTTVFWAEIVPMASYHFEFTPMANNSYRDWQYIPRNMHTVFALMCFVVVIHWLIFPYPSGLLHWHCGNLTIAPVPAKQPWWIWINTSCEFIMNDCITTTKQSTTKPCAYFLGYTVRTVYAVSQKLLFGFQSCWRAYPLRLSNGMTFGYRRTKSFSQMHELLGL